MKISIRPYTEADTADAVRIWNEVVEDGIAFPQLDLLDNITGHAFFTGQTHTAVACDDDTGAVIGLYILHPNNIGRVGHIGNASYAVSSEARGQHVGDALVKDSLRMARVCGFRLMQFNAVVKTNSPALHLYEKNGFVKIGEIPGGFHKKSGEYEDIVLFYHTLETKGE